jgi:TPR repeat protein
MRTRQNQGSISSTTRCTMTLLTWATIFLVGCNQSGTSLNDDTDKTSCVADSLGALRHLSSVPTCTTGDWLCRAKCQLGDGTSCIGLAYSAEKDSKMQDEARGLYFRACVLGEANACTNYAATIWVKGSSDEKLACARRTFEKACAAKEPFACGMVGRMMLESTTPPSYAEGRRYLETNCDHVGGFSCRVLAKHLESGKLGEYQPEVIRSLLDRACSGGDPDACGTHATALETFQ